MAKRHAALPMGLIVILLWTAKSQPALASWPTDPTVNLPVCTAPNGQIRPTIVTDGAGGAIVTWSDARSGVTSGIYAQRVLASGSVDPSWPFDGRALCTASGDASNPMICPDGAGGAIVTWYDSRNGDSDIYAQHVAGSGAVDPNWSVDGQALCTAPNSQSSPTICEDGAGGSIVTWYDYRVGSDIYAQHVQSNGVVDAVWPNDGRAVCIDTKSQYFPLIVSDGEGGAILTWRDDRNSPPGGCPCGVPDVYAQHVQASGVADPEWPVDGRGVCTADSSQYPSGIVEDGQGGAIIGWSDERSGDFDVYVQHVLANGALDPAWPAVGLVLCNAENDQFSYSMIADGAGGALVAWFDGRSGDNDIYVQHVMASGTVDPAWPANGRALCAVSGDQQDPVMVSDELGGALVAWTDLRESQVHIYAQHVLASGDLDIDWPANGSAISLAAGNQVDVAAVTDGTGGAIMVWEDTRNGSFNYDIYAQRVQSNGQLGGDVVGVAESPKSILALSLTANPSSRSSLSVRFTLATAQPARLELFDVSGRRLVVREVGSLGPGSHLLELGDPSRLRPGMYFLRLTQGLEVRGARVAVTN